MEKTILAKAIAFLEKQDLIKKETVQNQTHYSTTPRGDKVSRYFGSLPQQQEREVDLV